MIILNWVLLRVEFCVIVLGIAIHSLSFYFFHFSNFIYLHISDYPIFVSRVVNFICWMPVNLDFFLHPATKSYVIMWSCMYTFIWPLSNIQFHYVISTIKDKEKKYSCYAACDLEDRAHKSRLSHSRQPSNSLKNYLKLLHEIPHTWKFLHIQYIVL